MASATKRGQGRWDARYRGPDGKERTKRFTTKGDALAWAQDQEAKMRGLVWTDPGRARITVGEWSMRWFETLSVQPKTLESYRSVYRSAVEPRWGRTRLDGITLPDVKAWVANMKGVRGNKLSASRVRQSHRLLAAMLDLAVEDGRLPRNPAHSRTGKSGGYLPKLAKARTHRYLTHAEVAQLVGEVERPQPDGSTRPEDRAHGSLILVLAYTGMRWGEATSLRVSDLDLLRRKVSVRRTAQDLNGVLTYKLPKSHAQRTVPIPSFLCERLASLATGKKGEDLVFVSPQGQPLYTSNFRARVYGPALKSAGLARMTIHDLRHTAASLAVGAGVNVKGVQRMLGHASASMTLDTYADLFDDHLDEIAGSLDVAARAAQESLAETSGRVVALRPS